MRKGEHQPTYEERSAFSGWRRFLKWRPGQRKAIKQRSNRRDRHVAKANLKVVHD